MYIIQDGSDNVLYTSYIYKDGQWIQLGQQRLDIDLSDYVTSSELSDSISDITADMNTLSTNVNNLSTSVSNLSTDIDTLQDDITSVSTTLDNKIDANAAANQAAINNITNTHYNKDQIDDMMENRLIWDDVYSGNSMENPTIVQVDSPGYNPQVGQNYASTTGLKIVTIEQSSYEELQTYEPNTIYFVLEPQTQTNWTFGGTFPITFASDGIGTFPIILQ